jgi:hypothetical protein
MKNLRVDIRGLVALELHNYDPQQNTAASMAAICLVPEIVQHAPRLTIPEAQVDKDSTTVDFKEVGTDCVFDVSGYNLAFQFEPPNSHGLTLPQDEKTGAGGIKFGPLAKYVPDMATLTGFAELKDDFKWPCKETDVVSALLLETGAIRARIGFDWMFWEGEKPEEAKWKMEMTAAEAVRCDAEYTSRVKISATRRNGTGSVRYILLRDGAPLTVLYEHHCKGLTGCEKTTGAQLPAFYDMLKRYYRRPNGTQSSWSETGYCPPTMFWT